MKKTLIYSTAVGMVAGLTLVSCSREPIVDTTPRETDFGNKEIVMFYNAALNTNRTYLYVDGTPVNGATIAYASAFPAHSSDYGFVVEPGLRQFVVKDTLSTSTQVPLSFSNNIEANKRYTIFFYDTLTAPKQLTVETPIVVPQDTSSRIRFAYFFRRAVGVPPPVDIFSKRLNQNLVSNVQFAQVSDFMAYPSNTSDTLYVREAGTMNQLGVWNGFSSTRKRSYTLVLRGGLYTTTGTNTRDFGLITEY